MRGGINANSQLYYHILKQLVIVIWLNVISLKPTLQNNVLDCI